MDTSNPLLTNPLFIAAVLLFLILLPLFLRQKKKSALDMVLDQYEKEETKAIAKESAEKDLEHEKSSPPDASPTPEVKDEGSIPPVRKEEAPEQGSIPPLAKQEVPEQGGIPAFPASKGGLPPSLEDKGGIPFPDGKIKVAKEGVSISHNEATDAPPALRKKKKFVSEGVPVSHNEEVVPQKEAPPSDPKKKDSPDKQKEAPPSGHKKKDSPDKQKGKKWVEDFFASPKKDPDDQESVHKWIEADIPGLIIEPLPEKKVSSKEKPVKKSAKDIPTFKAPPQEKEKSKAEKKVKKTKKSISKEKGVAKVKNLDARAVEKKAAKTEKRDKIKAKTPELTIEIPDSGTKAVEKEAIVVSHKDIIKKPVKPASLQKIESSAPKEPPKPFFLDLKFLIEEERESAGPDAPKKLSPEMVDRIVARLSELQVNLESQLTSLVQKAVPEKSQGHGDMRQERVQDSPPGMENKPEELSDKKEVSLEELDSFLFTASQRKNSE